MSKPYTFGYLSLYLKGMQILFCVWILGKVCETDMYRTCTLAVCTKLSSRFFKNRGELICKQKTLCFPSGIVHRMCMEDSSLPFHWISKPVDEQNMKRFESLERCFRIGLRWHSTCSKTLLNEATMRLDQRRILSIWSISTTQWLWTWDRNYQFRRFLQLIKDYKVCHTLRT